MEAVSVLFFIQNFEVKRFDDCAGYREVVKPMLASGLVKDHRISFHERSHDYVLPLLKTRLSEYAQRCQGKKVVIYGAGIHTESLLSDFENFNVVAIADREKKIQGTVKWGFPIISPEEIQAHADIVLISSRAFESAIMQDLQAILHAEIQVLPLYQGLFDRAQWHQSILNSLLDGLSEFHADILFFLPSHPEENLKDNYFEEIKFRYPKLKIITLWWDYDDQTDSSKYLAFERESLIYSDLIIENTNCSRIERMRKREGVYKDHIGAEKVIFHPTVPDPEIFYPRDLPKIYDVAIFGSSAGQRQEWIEFLEQELGDRFHHIGGVSHGDETLPMEEYAKAMAQTKIVVNTQTYPFRIQCKGRVREAIGNGVFLLEEKNDETVHLVEDKQGLVYFSGKQQLIQLITYYLSHESERRSIEYNGASLINRQLSPEYWVETILEKLLTKPY